MAFEMTLWKIDGESLSRVEKSRLDKEARLEGWIDRDPAILGLDILIIGRQVQTSSGGWIDLLGMNRQGDLVILELKRDKTPRDIVAQVLDYASWVNDLNADEIENIAEKYLKKGLSQAFSEFYNTSLPDNINTGHSMVIVASEMDDSTERIVQYLSSVHNVNINVVFFNYFKQDGQEFLGRSWMMDPEEMQERIVPKKRVPWSGYYIVNVGESEYRDWDDCRKYGFISAGQGLWYKKEIQRLKEGDKIFAYLTGKGYVGYGIVRNEAVMVKDFIVGKKDGGSKLLSLPLKQKGIGKNSEDSDNCEWAVKVEWIKTFPRETAKTFKGIAAYGTVAKITDQKTIDFLIKEFGIE